MYTPVVGTVNAEVGFVYPLFGFVYVTKRPAIDS